MVRNPRVQQGFSLKISGCAFFEGFIEQLTGTLLLQLLPELRLALLTDRRYKPDGEPGLVHLIGDSPCSMGLTQLAKMGILLAVCLQSAGKPLVEGVDADAQVSFAGADDRLLLRSGQSSGFAHLRFLHTRSYPSESASSNASV